MLSIKKDDMKIFCIALKDNKQSIKMLEDCLLSAKNFDWNVEVFWGVNKDSITKDVWKHFNISPSTDVKFRKRLGAQGCFLSHYQLWLKCLDLNTEIIILEHDAIINSPLPEIVTDKDLVKLYRRNRKNHTDRYTGIWNVGSHAYYITPQGARKLIKWSKNNFGYHVDTMLGDKIVEYEYFNVDLVTLNKNNESTIF